MAVVKLWNICKRSGRSNAKQMRDSTRYIMDEIKTALSIPMEISVLDETGNGMTEEQVADLRDAMNEIRYLTNGKKTVEGFFTGAINCRLEHAVEDMEALKDFYGKKDGRILTCGVISFTEEDKDLGKCWAAGKDMLREIYGKNFQVVYSMHTNTAHPHVHFLINTVGLDGVKLHMKRGYVQNVLQPVVNRCCRAYDLIVNENFGRKQWDGKDIRILNREIAADMDAAIEKAESLSEFVQNMKLLGYRVTLGKSLTVQKEGMRKGRWTDRIGADYTLQRVMERIRDKRIPPDLSVLPDIPENRPRQLRTSVVIPPTRWKNMTEFQKENVRLLFQQGRNPFQEQRAGWIVQKHNMKLFQERRQAFVYVKYGVLKPEEIRVALSEIRQKQEEIKEKKRHVTEAQKDKRAMFKLVKRAEELETRALTGRIDKSYEAERQEFQRIKERLEQNFGQNYRVVKEYRKKALAAERAYSRELDQLEKEAGYCYAALHRLSDDPIELERKEKRMESGGQITLGVQTETPETKAPEAPENADPEVVDLVKRYGELTELQNDLREQKKREEEQREKRKLDEQKRKLREQNLRRGFHL